MTTPKLDEYLEIIKKQTGTGRFVMSEEASRLLSIIATMRSALLFYENTTRLMLQVRDLPIDPISLQPRCAERHIQDDGDTARLALRRCEDILQ